MPIYEYRCESCGHEFEEMQRMSDARLTDCPECGKPELKKLISAAGFQLKGTGWYETDFKNNGKKSTAKDKPKKAAESGGGTKKASGCAGGGCGCH